MTSRIAEAIGRDVPRETYNKLEAYVRLLVVGSAEQNLIAASTLPHIWERHILDSAQLVAWAPAASSWLDIGSGAGLPGIVTAIVTNSHTTLVEPRRLRVKFLESVKQELSLANVNIVQGKADLLRATFDVITARAVAPATALLDMTIHLSHKGTSWLLPKGRTAQKELEEVRATWQGDFRLVPSRTDAGASILIASKVRPRGRR